MSFDSSSGKVSADVEKSESVEGDSSSGNYKLWFKQVPSETEIDTSSGDITLYLPKDSDFKIDFDTSSGDFDSEHNLKKDGHTYTSGSGSNKFNIDTSSGDVTVKYYDD